MHEQVSLNGRIIFPAEADISAVSSAALYGKGVFTAVAVFDGQAFLWEQHWHRLANDAAKLSIDISGISEQSVLRSLAELADRSALKNGRARVTLFDGSSSDIWPFETGRETSVLITMAAFRETPGRFRLTVSPYHLNSDSPLAGVKSCNYLENLLCLKEARGRGFHEAVRLNERGDIASACMANIFWERDEQLFTPSIKTGCLRGTTRDFILVTFPCSEVEFGIKEFVLAERIFLTSAGVGIVSVKDLDGRKLPDSGHPILELFPKMH